MTRQTPALLFVVLVAAGFSAWFFFKPDPQGNALHSREAAAHALAEYLAQTQPGKRALIVSNPFTQRKETAKAIREMEQAGIRGLRAGFGDRVTVAAVAFPELKPGARENPGALLAEVETTTPLSYLIAPDAFDKLAKQHPDCDLIVSLIGLPAELGQCESWQAAGAPKFALLLPDLRIVGDTAAVCSAVKSGKLAALVLARPRETDGSLVPGSEFKAGSEQWFVLVTRESVDQVVWSYPGIF